MSGKRKINYTLDDDSDSCDCDCDEPRQGPDYHK